MISFRKFHIDQVLHFIVTSLSSKYPLVLLRRYRSGPRGRQPDVVHAEGALA